MIQLCNSEKISSEKKPQSCKLESNITFFCPAGIPADRQGRAGSPQRADRTHNAWALNHPERERETLMRPSAERVILLSRLI